MAGPRLRDSDEAQVIIFFCAIFGLALAATVYFAVASAFASGAHGIGNNEFPIGGLLPSERTFWLFLGGFPSGWAGGLGFAAAAHLLLRKRGFGARVFGLWAASALFAAACGVAGIFYYEAHARYQQPKPVDRQTVAPTSARVLAAPSQAFDAQTGRAAVSVVLDQLRPGNYSSALTQAEAAAVDETQRQLGIALASKLDARSWQSLTADDRAALDSYTKKRWQARPDNDTLYLRAVIIARAHGLADVAGALAECDATQDRPRSPRFGYDICRSEVASFAIEACVDPLQCQELRKSTSMPELAALLKRDSTTPCSVPNRAQAPLCQAIRELSASEWAQFDPARQREVAVSSALAQLHPGNYASALAQAEAIDPHETFVQLRRTLGPRDASEWHGLTIADRAALDSYTERQMPQRPSADEAYLRYQVIARLHGLADVAGAQAQCDASVRTVRDPRAAHPNPECRRAVATVAIDTCVDQAHCQDRGKPVPLQQLAAQIKEDSKTLCTNNYHAQNPLCRAIRELPDAQ